MTLSRSTWVMVVAWVVLVGGCGVVFLLVPPSEGKTLLRNVVLCLVPLFANAGLLLNAASPYRRQNAFWALLALGSTLWMAWQLLWIYAALGLRNTTAFEFPRDLILFLQPVPMIGAAALQPHARGVGRTLRYGYLDLLILAVWWIYFYLLAVTPWQYVSPDPTLRAARFTQILHIEMLVLLGAMGWLVFRSSGTWRSVYVQLMGATALLPLSMHLIGQAERSGFYHPGNLADLPQVAAFVWFGTAGIVAQRLKPEPDPQEATNKEGGMWPARLAMCGLLSIPLVAGWSAFFSSAPEAVRDFRLMVTLVTIVVASALVFLRQHLMDMERLRLLRSSQETVENLRRLQSQFVQSEKLAALGQLAAGAAHEINNPLTAILGYADLLIDDTTTGAKQRDLAEKLREQARRTNTLVTNLLSFARQVPAERSLLDINAVVTSALQLRTLDLRSKGVRIELQKEAMLPGVRGDKNQLLQVFHNLISNAVDAMEETGGGALTVRTRRAGATVVIEFTDNGPGIREPNLVFDPFYTTKAVGHGTGLGLSICYGIVQEHRGRIICHNESAGGATFRIELPAILALFPQSSAPANSKGS